MKGKNICGGLISRPIQGIINVKTFLITIIVVVYIVLPALFIVYLCIQNRNSDLLVEKILSAFGGAIIVILSALLFSLRSEEVESNFASTVIFHKLDKTPLDNHLDGDGQLKFGGHQFIGPLAAFINKHVEKSVELNKVQFNKDSDRIVEFYHNIILIRLLDQFFWMYSARWDTNVYSVRRGMGELKESYVDSEDTPPNCDRLNWTDLFNDGQQSNFHDLLSAFSNINETKVPPKTKIRFVIREHKKEILLRNPFVKVTITVNKSGGSSGLGDYKWLLGYINDRTGNEFWSAHFRVTCSAKFAKLKSGHPDMPKYKQWVRVLFGEVQYLLDEKEQLKRAHEYRELVAL